MSEKLNLVIMHLAKSTLKTTRFALCMCAFPLGCLLSKIFHVAMMIYGPFSAKVCKKEIFVSPTFQRGFPFPGAH